MCYRFRLWKRLLGRSRIQVKKLEDCGRGPEQEKGDGVAALARNLQLGKGDIAQDQRVDRDEEHYGGHGRGKRTTATESRPAAVPAVAEADRCYPASWARE